MALRNADPWYRRGYRKRRVKIWLQDNEIVLGSEEIVELIKARPALADPEKN